jgi:hypothetical protein
MDDDWDTSIEALTQTQTSPESNANPNRNNSTVSRIEGFTF